MAIDRIVQGKKAAGQSKQQAEKSCIINEYYSSIHPSIHECIFSINEYYSFFYAWFIHRFLRENILVIHSSCAWIIHLFTLDGNAYSRPSREEGRENQSVSQSANLQQARSSGERKGEQMNNLGKIH